MIIYRHENSALWFLKLPQLRQRSLDFQCIILGGFLKLACDYLYVCVDGLLFET